MRTPIGYRLNRPITVGETVDPLRKGIVHWGDSLTRDGVQNEMRKLVGARGYPYRCCAISGENSDHNRIRAIGITPRRSTGTASAGTLRVMAHEYVFGREFLAGFESEQTFSRTTLARPLTIRWKNNVVLAATTDYTQRVQIAAVADAGTDTFTAVGHGMGNLDRIWAKNTASGCTLQQCYFVRNATADTFQISLDLTGSLIDLSAGTVNFDGPYYADISHPGGAYDITVETDTDCSDQVNVIWVGANDIGTGMTTVPANVAAMVAQLGEGARYVIIIPHNNSDYNAGASGDFLTFYNGFQATRATLLSTYAGRVFDMYQYFMDQYIEGVDDATEHANGVIPSRLRADKIHFTVSAYADAANQIYQQLLSRDWLN